MRNMDNIVDSARREIGELAGDEEEARFIVGELAKTNDWSPYLKKNDIISSLEQRVAILESKVAGRPATQPDKASKQAPGKQLISATEPLPPGAVKAKDFYTRHGVPLTRLRYHTEKGMAGDLLETTDRIPYPSRPDYKERYITVAQQQAALAYWKRYRVPNTIPVEESEGVSQHATDSSAITDALTNATL